MKLVRNRVCVALLALSAAFNCSAAEIVLPAANSAAEGGAVLSGPLANSDLTLQWVFAQSEFTSLPSGSHLTAIGFRLDAGQPSRPGIPHSFGMWDLQLSTSVNAPGALDATFANNIGADAVAVRSGPLDLPVDALSGGTGPNDFFFIQFATPFTYRGGDLLITLRRDASAGASLLSLGALDPVTLAGVADSVRAAGAAAVSGQAHFANVPVTAFQFTPVPEAGSALLVATVLPVLAALRKRRRSRQE